MVKNLKMLKPLTHTPTTTTTYKEWAVALLCSRGHLLDSWSLHIKTVVLGDHPIFRDYKGIISFVSLQRFYGEYTCG